MNLQAKCGFRRRQRGLDEEMAWAVDHVKGTALESRVFYITMAASIYHIWRARNFKIFQNVFQSKEVLLSRIIQEVRYCMATWRRFPKTAVNQKIVTEWGCSELIFAP